MKRRDKIQGGGVFQHAQTAPERDAETLTQDMHGQRSPDALAEIDRDIEDRKRNRFGAFVITPTGLQVNGEAQQEDWQNIGAYLLKLHGAIQWLIGDWIVFGEEVKWGDIPAIAAEFSIAEKTLYDYAYVARHVQISVRTEKLTFGHHSLVVRQNPKDQHTSLQFAIGNHLSVNAFRRWLKGEPLTPALPSPLQKDDNWNAMESLWSIALQDNLDTLTPEDTELIREKIQTVRDFLGMLEAKLPRRQVRRAR